MEELERIGIAIDARPVLNYSMQQNYISLIKNVRLTNTGETVVENLTFSIKTDPAFASDLRVKVDRIEAGGSIDINPVRLDLSTEYLFSLTERTEGRLIAEVFTNETTSEGMTEECCVGRTVLPIGLLAQGQWTGTGIMPELLASFVMPNIPQVAEVLNEAVVYLKKWNADPAFTAYQTENPDNVKKQMAAIFAAISDRKINYVVAPASFETAGQRIRLPHEVTGTLQGNCIDMTLLFASCLEAAGLRPMIVLLKDHAFVGCWLEADGFADCVVDDVSALEKRTAAGAEEILLAECTAMNTGNATDFDTAVKMALSKLKEEGSFDMLIDIKRCRASGIRPMPADKQMLEESMRERADGYRGYGSDDEGMMGAPSSLDRSLALREGSMEKTEDGRALSRQQVWERKLLDLTLRNALLNFRATKSTVQLLVTEPGILEDMLSDGKDISIYELPEELKAGLRDEKMVFLEQGEGTYESLSKEELSHSRVRTFLGREELAASLKGLQRAAKVSLEENGANTLFLAMGFLRWYETEISEKARFAPLVLVPVDLVKSVKGGGYILRTRNEESQINITLLEYLRQDHGIAINGLDPIPEDEHGIDLPLVLQTIRKAVMEKKRWNVENMTFLGLFSFGQFVMWNDLRNRSEELKKSKVVSSLMEGRMNWEAEDFDIDTETLDELLLPEKNAVPLSADSSQLAAIAAAAGGQSFVLHGPPGTGKSQTITNMIANALYNGKSVLFVAEKMAALSVVQKRLEKIGLGPFSLELHSNKAGKNSVLGQLEKTLEVGRRREPEDYKIQAAKLLEARKELDGVISEIHKKRHFGGSLYDAVTEYEAKKAHKDKIRLGDSKTTDFSVDTASSEMRIRYRELIEDYSKAAGLIGSYSAHPLREVGRSDYSIELKDRLKDEWIQAASECRSAEKDADALMSSMGISVDKDLKGLRLLCRMAELKSDGVSSLYSLAGAEGYEILRKTAEELADEGDIYLKEYGELSPYFNETAFVAGTGLNAGRELAVLREGKSKWFLAKAMTINAAVKNLKRYAKDPSFVTKVNVETLLEALSRLEIHKASLNNAMQPVVAMLGGIYAGERTDFLALRAALVKADALKKIKDSCKAGVWKEYTEGGAPDGIAHAALSGALDRILSAVSDSEIDISDAEAEADFLPKLAERFERYASGISLLRDHTGYRKIKKQLDEQGLACVTKAFEEGRVSAADALDAFECSLMYKFALEIIDKNESLRDFRGVQFESLIDRYLELENTFRDLTVQELVAGLSAGIPSGTMRAADSSELGILKKAIRSGGRRMTIRKLFNDIPLLLRRLCPCMLMSPISVAQYIDPGFPKFDLVIFDEASQLPTGEAVGTIARGENAIIVGDPRQLPPTSFFKSSKTDDESMAEDDLESLLDDCLAISMPQMYLKWHYRSRHESLIAYSNAKYYDGLLSTFPSPNDLVSRVKLVHVDGVYDKGKSKQNRAEAEAVVAEIMRRLSDRDLRGDSIGVVTFSIVQQHLIEDMLADEMAKHPETEEWDRNSREPVFVKNLENVQGDERDVILFSVGYGPDKDGKVSMNFGPLNRDGGWRRLNVAVSRARKEMIVYAVLKPEQIDTSRSAAAGVEGLKGFLEYAEHGRGVLAAKNGSVKKADALADIIAGRIREAGYDVKTMIGCSDYRMDIGVIDPDDPDSYVLGIMLDGRNMMKAPTAADRFSVQPGVLKGLGWKIMRVWVLEWLDDPETVLDQIKSEIKKAIESPKEEERPEDKTNYIPEKSDAADPDAKGSISEGSKSEGSKSEGSNRGDVDRKSDENGIVNSLEFKSSESARRIYEEAEAQNEGDPEQYSDPVNILKVRRSIVRYLIAEAPIERGVLIKKVLSDWGVARLTDRIEAVFDKALEGVSCHKTSEVFPEGVKYYYWREDQDEDSYPYYRVENKSGELRSFDVIPYAEIRNAIKEVLEAQISLSEDDLIKETVKCFGFSRTGAVSSKCCRAAFERGLAEGWLKNTASRYSL
ncbi:MAG: DUF4011 domain-containing protein [Lachnospiraceae bacterium]|nr:DUF4011 domain-containing protein [Lachnospiraceae bacterium]